MVKLCAMALAALLLITLIRRYQPALAVETAVCAGLLLLLPVLRSLPLAWESLETFYASMTYGKKYFPVLLKALGITYLTEFTAAVCLDAGERAIAQKVELAGKVAIFFVALPVFTSLLSLLEELL